MSFQGWKIGLLSAVSALAICAAVADTASGPGEPLGFVTKVDSPTSFFLDKLAVSLPKTAVCEVQNLPALFTHHAESFWANLDTAFKDKHKSVACEKLNVGLGSWVKLSGSYQGSGFVADHVLLFLPAREEPFAGTALLQEAPEGSGAMWLDGYRITITPQTAIYVGSPLDAPTFEPRRHFPWEVDKKLLEKSALSHADWQTIIRPDTWIFYHATPAPDGTLTATDLYFWPNLHSPEEAKFITEHTGTVQPPDLASNQPGSAVFSDGEKLTIPAQASQQAIQALGEKLVPAFQKEMSETNPNKIHFRFYVIDDTRIPELPPRHGVLFKYRPDMPHLGPLRVANALMPVIETPGARPLPDAPLRYPVFDTPEPGYPLHDILAQPDGLVLMPASMFANLKREDQMAAMLSFAVTAILQKQAYQFNRAAPVGWYGPGSDLVGCGDYGGCFLLLYVEPWKFGQASQLIRMTIHDLLSLNLPIEDVPDVWSIARGSSDPNPFDTSRNHPLPVWYEAYTFTFLNQYYPQFASGFPDENATR